MEIYDKLTQVFSKDWFDIKHTGSCYGIVEEEKGDKLSGVKVVRRNNYLFKKLKTTLH